MDPTDWPRSWEEEAEWKAELEERDYDFLEELIDSAAKIAETSSRDVLLEAAEKEEASNEEPEAYLITA